MVCHYALSVKLYENSNRTPSQASSPPSWNIQVIEEPRFTSIKASLASLDRESSRNYKLLASWRIYCAREDQQSCLYMQKAFIARQMQKSDEKPFWWRSFSSYNCRENMKIASLSSKFWRQSQIAAFWSWETKWWCTLLLQSWIQLLERLVKSRALKWQQKRLAKTQALALALRITLHMWWCSETCLRNLEYFFAFN